MHCLINWYESTTTRDDDSVTPSTCQGGVLFVTAMSALLMQLQLLSGCIAENTLDNTGT